MKKSDILVNKRLRTPGYTLFILFLLLSISAGAQQIPLSRISSMPDLPQPYQMRNWKEVALKYDSLAYNINLNGDYLPLIFVYNTTLNYPDHSSFGLDSYIGSISTFAGEAVNVLPSVIGASLCGANKLSQYDKNWVLMCEEYFNSSNGENVYLNNINGSSGNDWWYETMPNIFFYQLNELYPHTGDFDRQFILIAERWKEAVTAMGGTDTPWNIPDMNYRAWDLINMEPLASGVREPEASGALAWILYNAYHVSGNDSYRVAAEWCMEYLNSLESNPAYELQLAYGTYTAARMNAELGTDYDLEKLLNWCFDIGPLRNWGAILGNWGGYDCSGLIGEQATGSAGYAFVMNGYQQAAALLPLLRYDDRYANALGKWILNLSNSSRLFYSAYLPADKQDNEDWTNTYDPESVIAYEALKESYNSNSPYATGDAMSAGWASTNLGLYGSSHVGMLGAILDTTDVEAILRINLCKTDFYSDKTYPVYLYYNPYNTEKTISYTSSNSAYDLYESISNQFIASNLSGNQVLAIPALSSVIIVEVPSGAQINKDGIQTLADNIVIDYNNGETAGNKAPRIKSLASADTLVIAGTSHNIYCTVQDESTESLTYNWNISGEWTAESSYNWTAPDENGYYRIRCIVKDSFGLETSDSILIHVVDRISAAPEIHSITAESRKLHPGQSTSIKCLATDLNNDRLEYFWNVSAGSFTQNDSAIYWTSPESEQVTTISCTVSNYDALEATDNITILVKDSTYIQEGKLVLGTELNGDAKDFSSYHNNGTPYNIGWSTDRNNNAASAAAFNASVSRISFQNQDYLNFKDGLSLLAWIFPMENITTESFILSHGSWQNRWKLSLTGNNILRFTINCSEGITDLDSERSLSPGKWYHLAAVYDGKDMEIYINDTLDAFKEWTGTINNTTYPLLAGQMLPDNQSYNFTGLLDNIRIYNYGVRDKIILDSYTGISGLSTDDLANPILVYPNPADEKVYINSGEIRDDLRILLYDSNGKICKSFEMEGTSAAKISELPVSDLVPGIYLLYFIEQNKTYTKKLLIF